MRRTSRTLAIVLCGVLLAAVGAAQDNPNLARGFESGKQYDFGGVDSVNLFNGSLTLTLPIGGSYPVDGALSYGLTLVYHSNVWDYQIRRDSFDKPFVQAWPRESTNAGLGWHLSLGRLYAPRTPGNDTGRWIYMSPDGGRHPFFATLHEGETVVAGVCYTRDASYLRLTGVGDCAGNTTTTLSSVEFPDGTVRRFSRASSASPFQMVRIRDRFNNQVNVDYSIANQWTITDGHRTHRVYFATQPSGMTVVDRVELAAFNSTTAVYEFNYVDQAIQRSCKDNDATTSATIDVSLLASVTLPEGLSYSMLDAAGVSPAYNTTCNTSVRDLSGTIQRLTLPTLGSIEWTYRHYQFIESVVTNGPFEDQLIFGHGTGVATKAVKEPSGACYGGGSACTWTYLPQGSGQEPYERKTTVTSPLGDDTVYYFDEDPIRRLGSGWQYGLPFKKSVGDGAGRFLSQEVYDGPVSGGLRKRAVYVRYDKDQLVGSTLAEGYHYTNRRLESQRIVYDDDPGRYADINYSNFDGLGHYRTAVTGGNFGAGDVRTTFTGYNPDASGIYRTYKIDPATNAPAAGSNFVMLSTAAPWVLETFAEQTATEGNVTSKTESCFSATTGFLLRQRILASGTARGATDVLVVFTPTPDGRGNLGSQEWYGGDVQPLATTTALCSLALPGANQYRIDNTYQYGSLKTSQHSGFSFKHADFLIDSNTGLAATSFDTAQLATQLEYDRLGRLTWSKPASGHNAWVQHVYTPATGTSFAEMAVYARPNGTTSGVPLSASQVRLDRFGRVREERQLMPGGTSNYSSRVTQYNALGWRTSVSEIGSTGSVTSFLNFDPFGRATTIRPPDGAAHDVTLSYTGTRTVSRTARIGNAWNGSAVTEAPATTTEVYDRQGRLWQVTEPPGGTSAIYTYNVLGLLSRASITGGGNTQVRLFSYDNRGFLVSERHPEKGSFGNGTVAYFAFDALGNPTRRLDGPNDLTFTYDRAGRLVQVHVTGTPANCADPGARCLKTFLYADANLTGDWRKGRLVQAVRYNRPVLGGVEYDATVTELYTYGGREGRISQLETRLTFNGTTNEIFRQSYGYNDLGQVFWQTYPDCAFAACPSFPRMVTYGYSNAWLTSVPGFASSLSYHPNGLLNQLVHSNGVVFTQGNDLQGMQRPSSMIATKSGVTLWSSGAYAYDGTGSVTMTGSHRYLYDLVGRVTENRFSDGQHQLYTYDPFGNLTSVNTTGSLLNTPTSRETNRLSSPSSYDGAGNQRSYGGSQYEYDELNNLKHFTSGSEEWLHIYTAHDERFWSYKVGPTRYETWTLRDLDGRVLREYANPDYTFGQFQDYVYRDGKLLAAVFPSGAQRHFDLDHLGSVRLVTDGAGTSIGSHRYFPYGKETTALQEAEQMKFTGHERDLGNPAGDGDDLDYMHARYYSPLHGRFLSFDPVGANPADPQSWNRYAYARGNPVKYTDPSGLLPDDPQSPGTMTVYGSLTVTDGKPGNSPLLMWWIYVQPRPGPFIMSAGRGERLRHDAYARAVITRAGQLTAPIADLADKGARAFDFFTGYVSAADALAEGDSSQAAFLGVLAALPGPLDNMAGGALVRTGTQFSDHAVGQMAKRGVTKSMVEAAIRKGDRYWDPKNKSVCYVVEGGFASGKSLLVGTNPFTGLVTTVIRGDKLARPRMVPLP